MNLGKEALPNCQGKESPSSKQQREVKEEEQTALKTKKYVLSQNQNIKIRNQIFALFKHNALKGKIKVESIEDLSEINIIFYHKINNKNIQQNIRVTFNSLYPEEPPQLEIHQCNLTQQFPQYIVPNFLALNQLLSAGKWNREISLGDVLAKVMETIEGFHASELQRFSTMKRQMEQQQESQEVPMKQNVKNEEGLQRVVKIRRKSSNMTGCADKELTQTKNLNRHFRSKLREVLRDLASSTQEQNQDYKQIDQLFTPNRVGFEDIRKALLNKWFNKGVQRQINSGQFLHKILRGMMGIKSKKLMIKYYHVMASAVAQPNNFTRWKYD